ncbi:MAG: hypothetical protein V3U60_10350 [Gammaproteobacteria bacterium]
MTEGKSKNRKLSSGAGSHFFALVFGSGTSFALATYWLEVSPGWLALLVGAVFSIVGVFLGENIGDAIVFSLIGGIIVIVFFMSGLEIAILRAVIIPVVTGLCIGKLVVGISKEMST